MTSPILTEFKYYEDDKGALHAFAADGSQDAFIPAGLTLKKIDEVKDTLVPPFNLDQALEKLVYELNAVYETFVRQLNGEYSPSERDTWPLQLEEAKEYRADATTPTPFIDAVLAHRDDITKDEFIDKVIAKDASYRADLGRLTGIRQDHQKAIESIKLLPKKSAQAATEAYDLQANW